MSCFRRVAAFALAAIVMTTGIARAEKSTLIVFHSTSSSPGAQRALDWLHREAQRLGSAVVDLSPHPELASRAPVLLSGAIAAYEAQDFPRAIAQLDEAIAEAGRTGALALTRSQLADLYLYRALARTKMAAADKAWPDFIRAATVDITRSLDPLRFPPRVLRSMERAFEAVRTGPRTQFSVSVPTICSITLDGRPVLARQATSVASGEHFVRVDCPRSQAHGAVVEVFGAAQAYTPTIVAVGVASQSYLAEAKARGAAQVLLSTFVDSPPTLTLRTIEVASNRSLRSAVVSAADRKALHSALRLALGKSILTTKPKPIVVTREPERAWYQKPWLWGLVGVGVGAAVVLPFVFDGEGSTSVIHVRPEGLP